MASKRPRRIAVIITDVKAGFPELEEMHPDYCELLIEAGEDYVILRSSHEPKELRQMAKDLTEIGAVHSTREITHTQRQQEYLDRRAAHKEKVRTEMIPRVKQIIAEVKRLQAKTTKPEEIEEYKSRLVFLENQLKDLEKTAAERP